MQIDPPPSESLPAAPRPPRPVVSPVLAALRRHTQEHHVRLERRLDLLDAALSLSRYRALLLGLHGFYLPIEALVEGSAAAPGLGDRRKQPLLAADLQVL